MHIGALCHELCNKSSAAAEMGDCFATINIGCGLRTQAGLPAPINPQPYLGAAVPLSIEGGSWVPI